MSVARSAPNAGHFYSNIVSPVKVDMQFTVDSTDSGGYGITSLKSNGYVVNVFMNTSATPAGTANPDAGYAQIVLKNNFNTFLGHTMSIKSPVTGSALAIDGSALNAGAAYEITTVGAVPNASFTITTIADTAGSLTGDYFTLSDNFGNNYVLWFQVSGAGTPPALTGSLLNYTAVPVAISTNDADTAVATAVEAVIDNLNSAASFTASTVSATVTVTSAVANQTLTPAPGAGTSGFTVSAVSFTSLAADWQVVGFPVGFTPAVGAGFIASATGGADNTTGRVKALGVSGVTCAEICAFPDYTISNSSLAANGGAQLVLQFLGATNSSTTTLIPKAPAAGSVVSLSLYFDQSSVTIDGL